MGFVSTEFVSSFPGTGLCVKPVRFIDKIAKGGQ